MPWHNVLCCWCSSWIGASCRNASEKGAEEEAERQLVSVKKLKGEVARREGMLKATQAELDKVLRATQPV